MRDHEPVDMLSGETIGQDLLIGYVGADREEAELCATGSHAVRFLEPAAAVAFVLGRVR